MVSNWRDAIVVSRPRPGALSVYARKYVESFGSPSRWRWETLDHTPESRLPRELIGAIDRAAELLNIEADDWASISRSVATLDWILGSAIADIKEASIPLLPDLSLLSSQRSLRSLGRVAIGVEWGYDRHDLGMSFEQWVRILKGEPYSAAHPYRYEGKRFTAQWHFDVNEIDQLRVGYDDGGEGWKGALDGMDALQGKQLDGVDLARLCLKGVAR